MLKSIRNFIIKYFTRIINRLLGGLGVKLKLSEILRIVAVKVAQSEISTKKMAILETLDDPSLPEAFDLSIYRELNRDLDHLNDEELRDHYVQTGMREGRACSLVRNRKDFIEVINNFKGARLEIGPFCSPVLGNNTETYYSDYFSTTELQLEAVNQKRNPKDVPKIDYQTKEISLAAAVGTKRFSVVVSCHNVEHYPDLITHLKEVSAILSGGGYYFLIIPDKRYTADYYQESSQLAGVLAAYVEKRKVPNVENVLKGLEFVTHNYPQRHWLNDHGANPHKTLCGRNLSVSLERIAQSVQKHEYNDLHCWTFQPQSFSEIVTGLCEIGFIDLRVARVFPTVFGSNEFYAVLQKTN